uniref:hypothetical protein n=1 Tax=Scandinavium goeteborgense TaxID=1851514 RepID=UPI001356D5B0|nr:hypothetical protein [Scandinavium goeteborgense]
MTTGTEMPRCPTCNLITEFGFKDRAFITAGVLKCPYNHHRAEQSFHSGSSKLTMKRLLREQWDVQISKVQAGEEAQ